jgi:F0F1-type ATP synthase assembly protein I
MSGWVRLGVLVAVWLLVPTLLGIAADRLLHTMPVALVVGAAVGVLLASVGVAREGMRSYARLAPPGREEEDAQ